jgi:hypothetical protein
LQGSEEDRLMYLKYLKTLCIWEALHEYKLLLIAMEVVDQGPGKRS